MPGLLTALREQDLGYLRIAAGFWGFSLDAADPESARQEMADRLLDGQLVGELVAALSPTALSALSDIARHAGRLPWARFVHLHGAFRKMGAARRDRERPYEAGASPVEMLYYRALIARAFLDTPEGPQEFAYIPDDLLPLLPSLSPRLETPPGRPASDEESSLVHPAGDRILDDATTLLAALRTSRAAGLPEERLRFLFALLSTVGLVDDGGMIQVEEVRRFLEEPRGAALASLAKVWAASPALDDLEFVPSLDSAGGWSDDPQAARRVVLETLAAVPRGTWWSLKAFIAAFKQSRPDFLRPDGDFDRGFLRDRASGGFLRGVEHWDLVEGALLGWLLRGPLHWLGIIDLAGESGSPEDGPAAFRISKWAGRLLQGIAPDDLPEETEPLHVRSDGRINAPRLSPRAVRYLLARFCAWEPPVRDEFRYRPTPSSLSAAADNGLQAAQLIQLLAKHSGGIPPNVTRALKNWEREGEAARIETTPVLRLPSAKALSALQASRAARFLGDVLGPAAVSLKPGSERQVLAALVELGYLGEIDERI